MADIDYGICYGSSRSGNKVTVYLNDVEISKVVGGSGLETSKVIEFDFNNLDTLKIEESHEYIYNSFLQVDLSKRWIQLIGKLKI